MTPLEKQLLGACRIGLKARNETHHGTDMAIRMLTAAIEAAEGYQESQNGDRAKAYRKAAERKSREDEMEIEADAMVSFSDENPGAYVQAWLWVSALEANDIY